MQHLVTMFLLLTAASICHATSNITFSGGGYEISVLLSDEDCKIVGLNVSGGNPNIISIGANEVTAFSKAESDCKKENNPSRGAPNTISSLFRIKEHQQKWPPHCRGEESEGIARLADVGA